MSAIARHTGRDRKTVRRYLAGEGARGRRVRPPSCLEPFRGYVQARFGEDPHLLCSVLYRELVAAGFERSYPTLVREVRRLGLRPVCKVCKWLLRPAETDATEIGGRRCGSDASTPGVTAA